MHRCISKAKRSGAAYDETFQIASCSRAQKGKGGGRCFPSVFVCAVIVNNLLMTLMVLKICNPGELGSDSHIVVSILFFKPPSEQVIELLNSFLQFFEQMLLNCAQLVVLIVSRLY